MKIHGFLYVFMFIVLASFVSAIYTDPVYVFDMDDNPLTTNLTNKINNTLVGNFTQVQGEVAGINGNAYDFEQTASDFVNISPRFLHNWSAVAINFWMKLETDSRDARAFTSVNGNYETFFDCKADNNGHWRMSTTATSNDNIDGTGVDNQSAFQAGVWQMITLTFDGDGIGSSMTAYVNGTYIDSIPTTGNTTVMPNATYIGQSIKDGFYFDGLIDEIYVYDHNLSQDDVWKLYNERDGNFWPFPATLNVQAYDESTNTLIEGETFTVHASTTGFSQTNTSVTTNPHNITGLSGGLYTIRVSSTNYPEREINDVYVVNNSKNNNVSIYLMNSTLGSSRTFTVLDSNSEAIEDVIVTFKRTIGGNTTIIAREDTDFAGVVSLTLDPNYEYNINFSHPDYNEKIINLEPTDTAYTVYLDTSAPPTPPIVDVINIGEIMYNLTYNNNTRNISFVWYDADNYASGYSLDIRNANGSIFFNDSTNSNLALNYILPTSVNQSYMVIASAQGDLGWYVLDTLDINEMAAWETMGKDSLILTMLVFLTLSFVGLFAPVAAVILGMIALVSMFVFGMLPVGGTVLLGLGAVVVAIVIGMGRRN